MRERTWLRPWMVGAIALAVLGGVAAATIPAFRASGIQFTSNGASPIASGAAGLWWNGSTSGPKWRKTDGSDLSLGTVDGLLGAYNGASSSSSNIIGLTSGNGAILVRDNATPIGGNLLAIQNSSGGTTYFGVSASAITLAEQAVFQGSLLYTRSTVSDTNYSAVSTDTDIVYTSLTAARTVTLPAASSGNGRSIVVRDETGKASVFNISVQRSSSDTVNGVTSAVPMVLSRYGEARCKSNGSNAWACTPSPNPALFYSVVDILGGAAVAASSGNFTTGNGYTFTKPLTIQGFRIYWGDAASKTITCTVWDPSGTNQGSVNISVSGVGYYTGILSSPYTVTSGQVYQGTQFTFGMYETGGTLYMQAKPSTPQAEPTVPYSVGYAVVKGQSGSLFLAGNNKPTSSTSTWAPIEPITY